MAVCALGGRSDSHAPAGVESWVKLTIESDHSTGADQPRGVSKDRAALSNWCRDVAPSTSLRKWFGHEPTRWDEFRERYKVELKRNIEPVAKLRLLAKQGPLTLVFGARDEIHNEAVVLRDFLLDR